MRHAINITSAAIGSSQIILKNKTQTNKATTSVPSRTDGKIEGREMGNDMDSWK
jgi:hypothetical protein